MNGYAVLGRKQARLPMTVIEIRAYRNGWQVYEAPRVQPVFLNQQQAIATAAIPKPTRPTGAATASDEAGVWDGAALLGRR
jgi:hypothetical protein